MTCPKSPMFARSNPPANEDRDLMMGEKLSDSALDTIFRTARTYNGYTDEPVTQDQIRQIYDLLKMGPTSANRSEEHTSELQSLMRISYAVFCLKKKKKKSEQYTKITYLNRAITHKSIINTQVTPSI